MQQLMARKLEMTQVFDDQGKQLPITVVEVEPAVVVRLKTQEKDGYSAVQVGYGQARPEKQTKPLAGQFKNLQTTPRKLKEERLESTEGLEVGQTVAITDVINVGDTISVTALSRGKGFQGGVKRHGFAGGPKTHGQSDRHRAPGSIGAGSTPGKVWKGTRMAGQMGHKQITTRGLTVVAIDGNKVSLKGAVPGARATWVTITKQGNGQG